MADQDWKPPTRVDLTGVTIRDSKSPRRDPRSRNLAPNEVRKQVSRRRSPTRKHPYSIRLAPRHVDLARRLGRGSITYGIENALGFAEVFLSADADWPAWIEDVRRRRTVGDDDASED